MKRGKDRLLELMLYREAGGIGYELAIKELAKDDEVYYNSLENILRQIRSGVVKDK